MISQNFYVKLIDFSREVERIKKKSILTHIDFAEFFNFYAN